MIPLINDNLPLANFDIFNATYSDLVGTDCATCSGSGGFVGYEYQGDPPMGGMVNTFTTCENCIGQELCPGCMQPLALSFDVSAFSEAENTTKYKMVIGNNSVAWPMYSYETVLCSMPTDSFICLVCDWQYDPDRHYTSDDNYVG